MRGTQPRGCGLHLGPYRRQPDPPARVHGQSAAMTKPADCLLLGRWRIVEADLWERSHLDLDEPAMMTIRADDYGEIAFGACRPASTSNTAAPWSSSPGPDARRWTRSAAPDRPSCSTMARSKSSSPTISATRPSSKLDASRPQQPASHHGCDLAQPCRSVELLFKVWAASGDQACLAVTF